MVQFQSPLQMGMECSVLWWMTQISYNVAYSINIHISSGNFYSRKFYKRGNHLFEILKQTGRKTAKMYTAYLVKSEKVTKRQTNRDTERMESR